MVCTLSTFKTFKECNNDKVFFHIEDKIQDTRSLTKKFFLKKDLLIDPDGVMDFFLFWIYL